jgi:hypothetical protein
MAANLLSTCTSTFWAASRYRKTWDNEKNSRYKITAFFSFVEQKT